MRRKYTHSVVVVVILFPFDGVHLVTNVTERPIGSWGGGDRGEAEGFLPSVSPEERR